MLTIENTYVSFKDHEGDLLLVSVADLLYSGHPIDTETGDDLELMSNIIVTKTGAGDEPSEDSDDQFLLGDNGYDE